MVTASIESAVAATSGKARGKRSGYIPTLDGWRTVAVFAVIAYHARPIQLGGVSLQRLQDYGDRGVQLFFAISGLLICSRLLDEQWRHGSISLKGFYLRRLFRIQPAAIVMLGGVTMLGVLGILHISVGAMLASLFSYRNFFNAFATSATPDDRYTVHFWSLAVEEHFYLLLPAILLVARKRLVPVLASLSAIFLLWPPIAHKLGLTAGLLSGQRTDLALEDLFVPSLLAVLLSRPEFRARMVQLSRYGVLIALVIAALFVSEFLLGGHVTHQITCFGFPLMIMSTMLHPEGWLGRLLETRLFTYFGRLSYSLYLWQQIFFLHRPETSVLRYVQGWPVNLIGAIVCAMLSYYFVEKPMMRLGHRVAPPVTPGRADLQGTPVAR